MLNDTITVNGQVMTIVGVAPPGFDGTTLGTTAEVFVPITMRALMQPGFDAFENRRSYWAYLFARLKPGVSLDLARAGINVPYRSIVNEIEAPLQQGMSEKTLAQFKAKGLLLEQGGQGQSSFHGDARAPLLLLLGVTALVLLIACANVGNLLLVRAAARSGEMAIRLSIGASRLQLVGQLLMESCLLAVFGGVVGLLVAQWTLNLVASLLPAQVTTVFRLSVDVPVLLFAGALTFGTAMLFGMFPALHSTRPDVLSALKGQSGQPAGTRTAARFRIALATMQIALSMTLLVSAGLFTKSLFNIARVDLGVNVDKLITFALSPELSGYTPNQSRALFERLRGGTEGLARRGGSERIVGIFAKRQ